MLTELVQTIKRAALDAVEAQSPAAPFVGRVIEEAPLQVRVSPRLTLTRRRLMFLAGLEPPEIGDRLALLRFAGGQRYLVLGKV